MNRLYNKRNTKKKVKKLNTYEKKIYKKRISFQFLFLTNKVFKDEYDS